MYRKYIPRDDDYLMRLKDVIAGEYKLGIIKIKPAKRGYYGETWKLVTRDKCYFAKLDYFNRHQDIFKNSLPVVDYLCSNGIGFINNVLKTQNGKHSTTFGQAILGIFEWVDGENMETDDTKTPEYQMLCDVYKLTKQGFDIPVMEFTDASAIQFYRKWELIKSSPQNKTCDIVLSILQQHSQKLNQCYSRLSHISQLCKRETPDFYFTHGDAGGNFLVKNNRFYIVDWDEVMYAPIERDAWVMSCHAWAVELFNDTLAKKKIPYILRPERLAFFCYHMFFHYLNEFIEDFILHDQTHEIEEYFSSSWIWERVEFADRAK